MESEKKLNSRFKIQKIDYKVDKSKTHKGYDIYKNEGGKWKQIYENLTFDEVIRYQTNDIGEHLNRLNFLSILASKRKK